jgi:hypothetical protein
LKNVPGPDLGNIQFIDSWALWQRDHGQGKILRLLKKNPKELLIFADKKNGFL